MNNEGELLELLRQIDDESNRLIRLHQELAREHERVMEELHKIRISGRKVGERCQP